ESLLLLLRMHWDHEPTPNPSQEGNGQDADECLFPSWEGSGVGWFLESIDGFSTAQSDHELRRVGPRRASVLDCGSPLPVLRPRTRSESARGLAQSKTWRRGARYMERLLSLLRRHWDHEPTPDPSQEGNARGADECLLPSWEGWEVGRFMESKAGRRRRRP